MTLYFVGYASLCEGQAHKEAVKVIRHCME